MTLIELSAPQAVHWSGYWRVRMSWAWGRGLRGLLHHSDQMINILIWQLSLYKIWNITEYADRKRPIRHLIMCWSLPVYTRVYPMGDFGWGRETSCRETCRYIIDIYHRNTEVGIIFCNDLFAIIPKSWPTRRLTPDRVVEEVLKGSTFTISAPNYPPPPPHSNGHSGALFSGAILRF